MAHVNILQKWYAPQTLAGLYKLQGLCDEAKQAWLLAGWTYCTVQKQCLQ